MAVIKVEVISDITCVWCYIGKRTLDKAISLYQKTYPGGKHDIFEITWRPYYLNHNASAESVDKSVLRETKLRGWSQEKIATATNRVEQVGRSVGINFKHGGKIGHTRDAHRLIHLTQTDGNSAEFQDVLVEKLFEAYHELEQDISDRQELRRIAVDAGLDGQEIDKYLQSDRDVAAVDEEAQRNRERVTNGVPTFFIQGQHRVDGAQDLQEFLEAFTKVKEAEQ